MVEADAGRQLPVVAQIVEAVGVDGLGLQLAVADGVLRQDQGAERQAEDQIAGVDGLADVVGVVRLLGEDADQGREAVAPVGVEARLPV
jgi:hypothetical protein